ncbi:Bug family tripartite tricarboxylate transporter substrate binding protein [Phreatobacter stygius]|nr:tripartite tricarboxylate transporter substrate-binding protein [Phreatobacter stygius]
MDMRGLRLIGAAWFGVMLALTGPVQAEDYPAAGRAIRVVVPFAAGGGTDAITRVVAEHVAKAWGAAVVIENKPGGGTMIASQGVAAAPADGYTVLAISNSFLVSPLLADQAPYDHARDFTGVALLASSPHVLVAHPAVPARNLAELAGWARAHPASASFASFGRGASNHLGFEVLKRRLGVEIVHVPYHGSAPALKDLIGGHVPMMLGDLQNVRELVVAGTLRAVAVANETRLASLPNVPTLVEAGIAGFTSKSWFGLVMRSGTSEPIVARWNAAVRAALADPAVRARLEPHGVTLTDTTPAEFDAFLRDEAAKAAAAIRLAGLK